MTEAFDTSTEAASIYPWNFRIRHYLLLTVMHRSFLTIAFALSFVVGLMLLNWLTIHSQPGSPLAFIGQILTVSQVPAAILAMLISGNPHGGNTGERIYWVLVVVQWFAIAYAVSALLFLRPRGSTEPDREDR